MSTWESEMTVTEGRLYEWCVCTLDAKSAYDFHVPANRFCPLCKGTNKRYDHYHCGVCVKLTQVG